MHPARAGGVLALLAASALVAILAPAFDLALPERILNWHIKQPSFVQGGQELVLLGGLAWLCLSLHRTLGGAAALCLVWLYLRRHHVDLPAMVALLLLEMLIALGAGIMSRLGRIPGKRLTDTLQPLALGIAAWMTIIIGLSLAGVGRPSDLKLAAGLLAIPILAWSRTRPLCGRAWIALREQRGWELALSVMMLVVFLGWLARTNNITGYDSLWYGLRPQQVLAPVRSFFDETGLVSPVYYFPKLYELLIVPLAAFRDVSYPFAFGVGLLATFGIAFWRFARGLGIGHRLALAGTLATMTIPAIGNTAVSIKTDLIAGLLALLATQWCWTGIRRHRLSELCWALAALALASGCKLIALPYAAALGIGALLMIRFDGRAARNRPWIRPTRLDWTMLTLATCVTVTIHLRTWWLTGMPTIGPEPLVALWRWLGFDMREPTGTLSWLRPQDWADLPALVHEMLLAPSGLVHLIISWTGNIWAWLMLAGAMIGLAHRQHRVFALLPTPLVALLTPTLLVGLFLAVGVGHMFRGGDGNYLIVPVACAMLSGLVVADRAAKTWPAGRTLLFGTLMAASAMQFAYSLANSHWGEPGTRIFDLDFGRSTFDTKHQRDRILADTHADDIAAALAGKPPGYRVVGYLEKSAIGYWLPARYEHMESIVFSRPDYVTSAAGFRHFLGIARIEGLILPIDPRQEPRVHDGPRELIEHLRRDPRVRSLRGARYELLDISALHADERQETSE